MTGTFGSFNTALSALRYQRVALDVAAGNIANVSTDGYVRRRAEAETVGGAQAALWSRSDHLTEGVGVSGVTRMSDALLDARVRSEHGKQAYLDTRAEVLERVESGIGEPGDSGVSAALIKFRQAWGDVANNPADDASRGQVLAQGASLVDAIRQQARMLDAEAGDDRARVVAMVTEVGSLAGDLAATNEALAVAQVNGADAGLLLDKRDQLALRLSELTGATTTLRSDGGFDLSVGGEVLVSGRDAGTFTVAGGIAADGSADGGPLTFAVTSPGSAVAAPVVTTGSTGALAEVLTTTLPSYAAGLDAMAKQVADAVNAQHRAGYDATGAPGADFFTYDAADPAGSLALASTTPGRVAASAVPGGGRDGSNADLLSRAFAAGEASYSRLVNSFGTTVASAGRLAATQRTLTAQVDGAREQLAGVSLDEEMVAMVTAQRSYEAAARLMTVVDSVLDTLINRTGLLR